MSNQSLTILMPTVLLVATFVVIWLMKQANRLREDILSGVRYGIPISLKHRWIIFSNDWVGFKFFCLGPMAVLGLAYLRLGLGAADADLQLVAYSSAGVAGAGVFFIAVLGALDLVFIVSTLRGAKKD